MRRDEKGYGGWGMGYGVWGMARSTAQPSAAAQLTNRIRPQASLGPIGCDPYPIPHPP